MALDPDIVAWAQHPPKHVRQADVLRTGRRAVDQMPRKHHTTQEMNTMNEASVDPDRQRGLYRKYELYRVDETDPTQRSLVFDPFFVLRYTRDPHARVALAAYATSCAHDYPQLAAELREALRKSDGAQPDDDPCPDDWDTDED